MSTPIYEQKQATFSASRTTANAGDYAGATTQVLATGTATPGLYVQEIVVTIRGTSTQGEIRFFKKCSTGPTIQYLGYLTMQIPARTVAAGKNFAWSSGPVKVWIELPDATWTLEFNMETADPVDVGYQGKSYV